MKRIGGNRRKSRDKLKVPSSMRGKIHISRFLQKFDEGTKVVLKAYPRYQHGLFNLRFYGKIGVVSKKQGECYFVKLKDGSKEKSLLIHPVHLLRV